MTEEQSVPLTGLCDGPVVKNGPQDDRAKAQHDPCVAMEESIPKRPYDVKVRVEVAS